MRQHTANYAQALLAYQKARRIEEHLVKENPADPLFRADLAKSYNCIGVLLNASGKLREALACHEQARNIRQNLVDESPTVSRYQNDLAVSLGNVGVTLLGMGKAPGQWTTTSRLARFCKLWSARILKNPAFETTWRYASSTSPASCFGKVTLPMR